MSPSPSLFDGICCSDLNRLKKMRHMSHRSRLRYRVGSPPSSKEIQCRPSPQSRLRFRRPVRTRGSRGRTYRLLLAQAMKLAGGRAAGHGCRGRGSSRRVSRDRIPLLPSRSQLISAIVGESLGPVRRFESRKADGRERCRNFLPRRFLASGSSSRTCAPRCSYHSSIGRWSARVRSRKSRIEEDIGSRS